MRNLIDKLGRRRRQDRVVCRFCKRSVLLTTQDTLAWHMWDASSRHCNGSGMVRELAEQKRHQRCSSCGESPIDVLNTHCPACGSNEYLTTVLP